MIQNRVRRTVTWITGLLVAGLVFWAADVFSCGFRAASGVANLFVAVNAGLSAVQTLQGLSWDSADLLSGAVAVLVAVLGWWYYLLGRPQRSGEEHGSARWGRPRDLRPLLNKNPERNLWFARQVGLSLDRAKRPEHQRNLNVLALGASGSGKSRYFLAPNLIRGLASGLVVDPKGELLAMTGAALGKAGYRIRVLNLVDFAASDGFNPLSYLRPGHAPEDVALLVRNIITNTTVEDRTGGDPFWERAESALMTALIGFVVATYPKPERHLGSVMDLLGQMRATGDHHGPSPVDAMFAAAENHAAANELLGFAINQYRVYGQAAEKTAASIIVTAAARLAPLHIPAVRQLLAADGLGIDEVGFTPTMLYLVISDADKQFSWLAATVFTTFFQRSIWLADQQPDRQLPTPVMCWMDEFANIGRIPDFEVLAATIRSRGISFIACVQDIGQGKRLYKDGWTSIVGNCDTVLFLGSGDSDTRKWVSERLGKETIRTVDTSTSQGRGGGSWQRKTIGRELMSADEIGRLPGNQAIVMIRGIPPLRAKKLSPISDK